MTKLNVVAISPVQPRPINGESIKRIIPSKRLIKPQAKIIVGTKGSVFMTFLHKVTYTTHYAALLKGSKGYIMEGYYWKQLGELVAGRRQDYGSSH